MFWFIMEDTWHIMEGPGVKQKSEPLSGGRTLKVWKMWVSVSGLLLTSGVQVDCVSFWMRVFSGAAESEVGAFAKVRGRVWESKDDSCSFLLTLVSRGMFWFIKEDTWHIMEGPGVKQKSEPLSGGRTLKVWKMVGAFAKVRGRVWESKDDSCSFFLTLVSRGMFWFIMEDTWHIMEGPGVKQKSEPLSGARTLKVWKMWVSVSGLLLTSGVQVDCFSFWMRVFSGAAESE
ncbi:hypothetical protein Ancab_019627 [Ancistrocladus abbreviatus]